jgi:hypothetical protein
VSTTESPSGSSSLLSTLNAADAPARTSAMSVTASGGRLVASLPVTSTSTLAEADSPRPSVTV